jgi:hypothetical protein
MAPFGNIQKSHNLSGQALAVRTAKMAVPRLGCGPAALY